MFHADYCFIRDKNKDRALTVLVGRRSPSKALFATMCDTKRSSGPVRPQPFAEFVQGRERMSKIAYRSDQEPAIVALILKEALEAHLGTRLPVDHSVMSWPVRSVASMFNRQSTNSDSLTTYEYPHGRRSHGRTAEFGERLMYYVPQKLRTKLDLRWRVGVFLGTAERRYEAHIGTRSGNVVIQGPRPCCPGK